MSDTLPIAVLGTVSSAWMWHYPNIVNFGVYLAKLRTGLIPSDDPGVFLFLLFADQKHTLILIRKYFKGILGGLLLYAQNPRSYRLQSFPNWSVISTWGILTPQISPLYFLYKFSILQVTK